MLQTRIVKKTVARVVIKLLKTYLVNGITDALRAVKSSEKFWKVGFFTKILGGYKYNSSKGINALFIMAIRGKDVKATSISIQI